MKNYEPTGIKFYDNASGREMILVTEGSYKNWIVYKHPDGQYVTLRKATDADITAITTAFSDAHHRAI